MSTTARMDALAASPGDAWGVMIGLGVLLALLGIAAIIYPAVATATINTLAGVLLIIAGVLGFGFAFGARDAGGVILWIVVALLAIVVGIVFLLGARHRHRHPHRGPGGLVHHQRPDEDRGRVRAARPDRGRRRGRQRRPLPHPGRPDRGRAAGLVGLGDRPPAGDHVPGRQRGA